MRTFTYTDEKSNKFWHIELQGSSFTVNYGRIGAKGQTQTKDFADEDKARKAHDKLVAEKLAGGYVETTASSSAASTVRDSLEKALLDNPDDVAAHAAYADLLMDQSDPRGEFVQVQLSLEDSARAPAQRKQFQEREKELLKKYARRFLGDAGRFLVGKWSGADKPCHYQFYRGWVDLIRLLPVPEPAIAALANSPEVRMLRRLEIVYDMRFHPFEFDEYLEGPNGALKEDEEPSELYEPVTIMPPLLASNYLANLRVFKLGFSDDSDPICYSTMVQPFESCSVQQIVEMVQKCPRLEELYLNTSVDGVDKLFSLPELGKLRVFQYYFGSEYSAPSEQSHAYPLTTLAKNKALKNLTTLRLHAGRDTAIALEQVDALLRSPNLPSLKHLQVHLTEYGDAGVSNIIDSGCLRRLKVLDIGYGNLTDAGAQQLAACADLKNLDVLDVSRNALTADGIAALKATGVNVVADVAKQHVLGGEENFLFEVDVE